MSMWGLGEGNEQDRTMIVVATTNDMKVADALAGEQRWSIVGILRDEDDIHRFLHQPQLSHKRKRRDEPAR